MGFFWVVVGSGGFILMVVGGGWYFLGSGR